MIMWRIMQLVVTALVVLYQQVIITYAVFWVELVKNQRTNEI